VPDFRRVAPAYSHGRLARLEDRLAVLRWWRWQLRFPQLRDTGTLALGAGSEIILRGDGRIVVGVGVRARPDLTLSVQGRLTLGDRVFLGRGVNIACFDRVTIGADTRLAERVSVHDANHVMEPLSDRAARSGENLAAEVRIGERVWLAANVVVLPGVTIGPDVVVGAGSVVTRDLPAGVLASGVPATVRRTLRP
jgi:acetyltransferase-like isoleucine patch superfamily enzyme